MTLGVPDLLSVRWTKLGEEIAMTDAQQAGLSDSTKRLLAVTAALIVIVVAVVIYGLVFARHNAAEAKRRACVQSHVVSADVATDDEAMKKIEVSCKKRFPG